MDPKQAEKIRKKIMSRLPAEHEALVQKIEGLSDKIQEIPIRIEQKGAEAIKLEEKAAQLKNEARKAITEGNDPTSILQKKAQIEQTVEALEEFPVLANESLESLKQELQETQEKLYQLLNAAIREVRSEECKELTLKLASLLKHQETWAESMNFDLAGITGYRSPVTNTSDPRLSLLECIHYVTKTEAMRLLDKSWPDRTYVLEG